MSSNLYFVFIVFMPLNFVFILLLHFHHLYARVFIQCIVPLEHPILHPMPVSVGFPFRVVAPSSVPTQINTLPYPCRSDGSMGSDLYWEATGRRRSSGRYCFLYIVFCFIFTICHIVAFDISISACYDCLLTFFSPSTPLSLPI